MTPAKFRVYQQKWVNLGLITWFWETPEEQADPASQGHGAYPFRWMAWLSAWWHTR